MAPHQRMKLRQSAGVFFVVTLLVIVLYLATSSVEGFTGRRCGVDLPSCQGDRIRCMNGYCRSDVPPRLPILSDLPLAG